jgi:hypothetical protein
LCRRLQRGRSVVTNLGVCDRPNLVSQAARGKIAILGRRRTRFADPGSGAQLPPQRRLVDVVDEGALAVDLHHREPLAVARLEVVVAGDVDRVVGDAEAVELPARPLAE